MPLVGAVIGARRRRQGIGQHVARWLAHHGVRLAAVVGTTPASAEEARAALAKDGVPVARAYAGVEALLAAEPDLSLVAVCSPIEAHLEALKLLTERPLHILCEKPVIYDMALDMGATVRAFAGKTAAAGRLFDTI